MMKSTRPVQSITIKAPANLRPTRIMPSRLLTRHLVAALLSLVSITSADADDTATPAVIDYQQHVLPILKTRCGKCHGTEQQEAQLRFDQLSTDLSSNRAAAQDWREALNAINAGEMPPEDEPQLSSTERATVTTWISNAIKAAIDHQRSTGGRAVLRRLNRLEYQNTMFDLLGLDMDYARDLPPDAVSPDGFRNQGQSLRMSSIQLEYYLDAARRAMDKVIVDSAPPRVFRHRFELSNVGGWRGPVERTNRLERAQKFLVKMVNDYPEEGEFRVRVRLQAELKPQKGYPLLEVAVGYRPDTEVHFRVAKVVEILSEESQQVEVRGRLENFPLPVRGQGKYPGLVVRLRNVYDDGSPVPTKLEKIKRDGKEVNAFRPEPDLPAILIESIEFEGPFYTQWPPATHREILFESSSRDENEAAYVREVLRRFMSRAYRRPADKYEVEDMFAFFASIRPHFTRFEDAIRETLSMVLIQPQFLFLMEPASEQKRSVTDWELASRLSYFLWSTMPDRQLLDLAGLNLLHEPSVLRAQIERMLKDEKAERLSATFVDQWLELERLDSMQIDSSYYPKFRQERKRDMRQETVRFFHDLLMSKESALNLLDSNYTLLNESLARHYGVSDVYGAKFRRVAVPPNRGGLLGQASVLLINSTGRDSHPIRRAVWIRDKLLNDPPAPPPPDVPELDEANPEFSKLSIREQLDVHREKESCNACHQDIDPWGIALEHFDAVGNWRKTIRKKHQDGFEERPVVSEDRLPNGTKLAGADGLRTYLVGQQSRVFARSLVRAMLTYALGRSLELSDEEDVDDLTDQFVEDGYRLDQLVHQIVSDSAFQLK